MVQPGDVEVWAWGDTGIEIPFIPFAEICPAPNVETPATEAISSPTPASISAVTEPPVLPAVATEPAGGTTTGCSYGLFSLALLSLAIGMVVVRRDGQR
jgi:hypothetical protein